MDKTYLVFIGDKLKQNEWILKRKIDFFDIIVLASQKDHSSQKNIFHYIPLRNCKNQSIYFCDQDFHIHFDYQALQISANGKELTDDAVYELLKYFAFLKDRRATMLIHFPITKTSRLKRRKLRSLTEKKHLTVSEDQESYGEIKFRLK